MGTQAGMMPRAAAMQDRAQPSGDAMPPIVGITIAAMLSLPPWMLLVWLGRQLLS